MAEERKDKSLSDELDDWAAAIDEWDANLALPKAEAKPEPAPAPAPKPAATPAAHAKAEARADATRAPAPRAATAEPALDDELPLEVAGGDEPPMRERSATPAVGVPLLRKQRDEAALDEPPALGDMPVPAAGGDDPLMHLFDGEMELPEEAGQALGTLLGDAAAAQPPPPVATLEAEVPELDLYADDFGGSTRVAAADEFDKLLADTANLADEPAAVTPPPPAATTPAPGFAHDATRGALAGEVDPLLADEAEVELGLPAPPPPSLEVPSTLPAPGSKLPSGRLKPPSGRFPAPAPKPSERLPTPKTPSGRFETPSGRFETPPPAPKKGEPPPEPTDLDVELELGPAIEQAVTAPPPLDEDFYDDIKVEAAREEPSQKTVAPAPPPPVAAPPPEPADELFEIDVEPAPLRPDDDRDRTPLPVADAEDFGGTAPARPLDAGESRPVVATRIAAPEAPLALPTLPELAEARPLDADYLRDQLALYDTERLLTPADDAARVARLAYAAGRVAERLGDVGGAIERYEAALEADPRHTHALRGLRRLRLADGKREPVLGMLDREIEQAAAQEKRGLHAIRAELALALGDRDVARAAYQAMLAEQGDDLHALAGLVDLSATGGADELEAALGRLAEAVPTASDAGLRAALLTERGRLDEAAGRVRDAVARYREAIGVDPTAAAAAWGLWRIAVRTPGTGDDLDTHARLVELLPAGPLRHALERRLGLLRARTGDVAGARPALQAAAADGDRLALADLAELERADGRLEEAAAALARVIDGEPDPGRRADRLIALGELAEKQGKTADAAAAYARAAQEYPDDPRAARALERTQAAGGDKESALARHLATAQRSPARAPMELTYAARLLRELGRNDEALARVQAALATAPALGPALDLAVELEVAAGRPDEAAAVLGRAADAVEEPGLQNAFRMRGARLLLRAGRAGDALALIRPVLAASDAPRAARWLETRILRAAEGQGDALRDSLRLDGESAELAGNKRRAAALAYELALSAAGDDDAVEALRRAVQLDALVPPFAVELAARLDAERRGVELPPIYQARLAAAAGRPEAVALALRLGATLLDDARDTAAATRVYTDALALCPGYGPAREGLDRVARAADDTAAELAALERERADLAAPDQAFAVEIAIGERLERRQLQPDKAAERYRRALELRPGHPVARQALDRALKAARNWASLADEALQELKDAPDPQSKVAAYERLAFIDGELRGDPQSALLGWQSILEVDHAHHAAMRVLEKHYLGEQRWPELVALYEQMGLTAGDPAFAVAVHLDRARLRRRVAGEASAAEIAAATDNDYRLALFKDRRCRPALRHVYARARGAHDLLQEADAAAALADATPDDPRTGAVMFTRSAESLVELDDAEQARARYQAAVERLPSHVPALVGLMDFSLAKGDWATAAHAAEHAALALRDATMKARFSLIAAALAQDKLDDAGRARTLLSAALDADPRSGEAFARLERLLHEGRDFAALAELYQRRLAVETNGGKLMALHLMLARIARDELHDRDRARAELRAVLSQDPGHPEALQALADLQFEDGQWAEAAETLIRRARTEKSRTALRDIFFKLGLIYSDHLPDPKRAVASFTRVLSVTPDDIVALEHLSNLHLKEWEWKGALQATLRLAEIERDKVKRVAHLHRVAKIYEEGFRDARHALEALRRALEVDPMYLPSIGELAKFFDRQSDVQSMRVHLDRTAARVRQLLDANPQDVDAFHALFKIFGWRRAPDRAAFTAGVLDWLGAADAEEKAMLGKLTSRDNYPGSSLADPTLDETLFDARVPAGFRNLFRLLDDSLAKPFRADIKRLGVQRHEKLPRSGHALRDVANRIAADLGVRDFDLYVTAAHPTALVVELTDPLSIIIGNKVIEGAHELELRFVLGRAFKMIQSHMALPMRLTPEDLGLLVGGIVRQFVPDFVPAGFEEAQIVAEAGQMAKVVPKKLHAELLPFALECANESLDLKQIGPSLVHTANRAGLLCCGLPGPALTAVRRLNDEAQLRALLRFTVSDELAELRRQLGTAIG